MLDAALDVVARVDGDGTLRDVSPSSLGVLGLAPNALEGTPLLHHVHPADQAGLQWLTQVPGDGAAAVTMRWRHAGGAWVWLDATLTALGEGGGTLLIARDVSSRRRVEEELLRAQKMEAVGRLAGGVAHDFNNVLSVLASAAALLLDEVPAGSASAELAEEIRKGCKRAAELTRQLLAFSGRQLVQPHPVDLRDVLEAVRRRAPAAPGLSLLIEVDGSAAGHTTLADEGQLEGVLLELLANARDAMPGGGIVTLGLRRFDVPADGVLRHGLPPGAWLALSVKDTGRGMDAAVQAHLFEPFFTTKPRGKGTGLGLATTWGVLRQFNGLVRVASDVDEGTTFTLLLPAVAAPVEAQPEARARLEAPRGRTVLLVEDDAAVRWIAVAVLQKQGLTVLPAEDGAKALAIAQRQGLSVDLLLTDVVMPGMSGTEVARAVLALQPRARVVFMSGYTSDPALRAGIRDASVHFLPKPFSPESLAQRVREVLDGA